MKKKIIFFGIFALSTSMWVLSSSLTYPFYRSSAPELPLVDLSQFKDAGKSWQIVGDVNADLTKAHALSTSNGTGILVNLPSKKVKGTDLFTQASFGDVEVELSYLMPSGGNSGIYLQGRYELQLEDSWSKKHRTAASNGGIYDLMAPRVNASKAPGLWQHLKIAFQAPRFNGAGEKIENARMLRVELNGVLVQENVELFGPTPGSISSKEVAQAPLRIQGDHGAVAFKDLKVSEPDVSKESATSRRNRPAADPILVEATGNTLLRSFMDIDNGIRVVHGISVGSNEQVHYTYDLDYGMLVQVWRGDFLDATPMWDGRGNGTSLPIGAVQRFGKPTLGVAKLATAQAVWPVDTVGTGYKPKGYTVDTDGAPTFVYHVFGASVKDASTVLADGRGLSRTIQVENGNDLYFRIAKAAKITETEKGSFLVGDKEYYLHLDNVKDKTTIRNADGEQELIVQIDGSFTYSILF